MRMMTGMSDDESASRTGRLASSATPRTYLFALTAAGGTIPPELGVARRLVDRGHSVTVLAEESIADQVRRTGAAYLPGTSGTVDEYRDWELRMPTSLARGMAEHMISGPAPDQARDTTAAIDALRPDLVLASFCPRTACRRWVSDCRQRAGPLVACVTAP